MARLYFICGKADAGKTTLPANWCERSPSTVLPRRTLQHRLNISSPKSALRCSASAGGAIPRQGAGRGVRCYRFHGHLE